MSAPLASLKIATRSVVIEAEPAEVWALLSRFGEIARWHPIARESRLIQGYEGEIGAERELVLADGSTVREALVAFDAARRHMAYKMMTFPIPVSRQENAVTVEPAGVPGRTRVTFTAEFSPAAGHTAAEIEAMNLGAFDLAARGLAEHLATRA